MRVLIVEDETAAYENMVKVLQVLNTQLFYFQLLFPLAVIQYRNITDKSTKQTHDKELEQKDIAHISSLNSQQRQAV